jgi:uncharacterized iron-regulated membrane protein
MVNLGARVRLLALHRWGGLTIGLLAGVVLLTGAIAVLRPEVERWLGQPLPASSGRGPFAPALAAIAATWPGSTVARIEPADAPGRADLLRVHPAGHDEHHVEAFTAYTDPRTGALLGHTQGSWLSQGFAWIGEFHGSLFLPGLAADILLGLCAGALLLFAVTGLILWWPGWARLGSGLQLRLRRTAFLRHFDLHRTLAVLTLPVLLATAVTGLFFTWQATRRAAYWALGGDLAQQPHQLLSHHAKEALRAGVGPAPHLAVDELVAAARRHAGLGADAPVLRITGLNPQAKPTPVLVAFDLPGNADRRDGGVRVRVDPASGRLLQLDDPRGRGPAMWLHGHQWALHAGWWGTSGSWGGLLGRGIWIIGGLALASLAVTGVGIWHHRRQQASKARAQRLSA